MYVLYFLRQVKSSIPIIPQDITSPIPTVSIKNGSPFVIPYAYVSIRGIMTVLLKIGGMGDSHAGLFLSILVKTAPMRVARLPKITSHTAAPVSRFEMIQPTNSPGTAAPVKYGRMQRASENRTCITPPDSPSANESRVSTTYRAAMIADCDKKYTLFLFFI